MTWKHAKTIVDDVIVRAAVRVRQSDGFTRELPYDLTHRAGRWFYARTMAPVFEWHVPYAWTLTPRTKEQQLEFERVAAALHGSPHLPSVRFAS